MLDTLPRFWTLLDESNNAEVVRQVSPFLDLARGTGAAVLLLQHERKSGGEDGREIQGGGGLFELVDHALLLEKRQVGSQFPLTPKRGWTSLKLGPSPQGLAGDSGKGGGS